MLAIAAFIKTYSTLIIAGLIAAAFAAYTWWIYDTASANTATRYELALSNQKAEAAKLLADSHAAVAAGETRNTLLMQQLEKQSEDGKAQRKIEVAAAVAAVHAGNRLRDPGGRGPGGSCPGTVAASAPGSSNQGTSGAELSKEASEFLLVFANECDSVVDQLDIARKYADSIGLFREEQIKRNAAAQ